MPWGSGWYAFALRRCARHAISATRAADSRSRLHEPAFCLGRLTQPSLPASTCTSAGSTTSSTGAPSAASASPTIASRYELPALQVDPVELHPAADDGARPLLLRSGRRAATPSTAISTISTSATAASMRCWSGPPIRTWASTTAISLRWSSPCPAASRACARWSPTFIAAACACSSP